MNLVCDLFVDGSFEGTIDSHKSITVGKNGKITGEVHAHHIIVQGMVEGTIDAERVEIKEAGRVNGSVISSEFVIEAKGIFEGDSKIKGKELKIPAPKPSEPANQIAAGA
ncbi:MAG: polymer-forming cytoskeletal protein [Sulfurimonadaceae bacterium]|nr:polymer-forming cytoskeletal protein [Sulfurimonadaceae bacterium]